MSVSEERRRYRSLVDDSGRWDGIGLRDGDIVIATPAKCGTTWMQMMCALVVFQTAELPGRLTDLSPWVDVLTVKAEDVHAQVAAQRHRRFMKSHTPLDGLPFGRLVTYITVARDPRDVALSWDDHFRNINLDVLLDARGEAIGFDDLADLYPGGLPAVPEDPIERFWRWVEFDDDDDDKIIGLRGLLHHLRTFWDRRDEPNVLLFHYDDLRADLDGEMRRLSAALGVPVDEAMWPALVQAATFDEMRTRADDLAPQVSIDNFWKDTTRFFESARKDGWRSFVDDAGLARYEARVADLADPEFAAWVHHGTRSAAGTD